MSDRLNEIDPVVLERMLGGFGRLSDGFMRRAAGHMTPEALEGLLGSALFILQLGAEGNFHGRLDVEFKGADILPVRVLSQKVSISTLYGEAFYGSKSGIGNGS